ncbi:uncharacterized protein DUF222 [Luteococcus japonicus]|uniref:Uncharacterized protein DUF222 n=1 Tax=Luteococcus japonicus TaxID=33984 RepID=A0A3N1ZT20_9ACTN|nr:HNH endonuclease signature motif containing protein [Luteococcus japonicus]ROR54024.1 uncharacterized protein DUF222 [Luteococcus japonicus]
MQELTSAQTVDAMLSARRRAWMAEAEAFELAAHFADLHAADPADQPSGSTAVLFGERAVSLGHDGTPEVAEFASLEIAAALNIAREAADCLIGDALSLRHRLPLLWQKMRDGFLRVGVARAIVAKTASLPLKQALVVDRELAPLVEGVSAYRLIKTAEGLVLALTPPEQAQDDYEKAQSSRGVWIGQSGHGVTDVSAVVNAADGIFLDAQLDRVAGILAQGGSTDSRDVRRSTALGILATPARVLQLLQASLLDAADDPELPFDDEGPEDAGCPAKGSRGHTCGTITVDPELLLPKATVVVHVEENTVAELDGIARVERCGPVLAQWMAELLQSTRVTVKPVIDASTITPSDSYEISARMRQVVTARNPYEVFPGSKKPARVCDLDHTDPWRAPSTSSGNEKPHSGNGKPNSGNGEGLTRPDNLGPLSRTVHRAKTHGGWLLRQLAPGMFFWRSPDGFAYLVTPSRSWVIHNPVTPSIA